MISGIVERAFYEPIVSIGQLTREEKKQLERAVKRGTIKKGRGGPYPELKTVYCHVAFDLEEDRRLTIRVMLHR